MKKISTREEEQGRPFDPFTEDNPKDSGLPMEYQDTKRPGYALIPYFFLLAAGVICGYFLPHPQIVKNDPPPATVEDTLKLLAAMPDPQMLGRYQFFVGPDKLLMRGDTITGEVIQVTPKIISP
jgi:hypothetical protein